MVKSLCLALLTRQRDMLKTEGFFNTLILPTTAPPGLIARIVTGGFTGACVSVGGGRSALVGAGLGLIGGIVGCFAGYQAARDS
jgi:uncharacterized membrane protein